MSQGRVLRRLGRYLRARQPWMLVALLMILHLTLLAGVDSLAGLMFWLVDVGLFILWQPFVQTERRLNVGNLLLVAAALVLGGWLFSWWLLIVWATILASLLGGRVVLVEHRPTRVFYLLAFAYLLGVVLIWLVPKVVPEPSVIGPSLGTEFAWLAPGLFLLMWLMPRPQSNGWLRHGAFDLFYGVFVFLLIAVMVLGTLAFMLLERTVYFDALFRTVLSVALLLLLVAWAWNPRPGFSGVGMLFSRHLLTIGGPFSTWLRRMMACAEREADPDRFFNQVCEQLLLDLPWVVGGEWRPSFRLSTNLRRFGHSSPYPNEFSDRSLSLTIFSGRPLSPILLWHLRLLTKLASEYYVAKWRARELQRVSYLQAIHETGARLTHDVKNLLQSLDSLCSLVRSESGADFSRIQPLMERQLPQIAQRLRSTLIKLEPPADAKAKETADEGAEAMDAAIWWEALQQRYAGQSIHFESGSLLDAGTIPCVLYDAVAENLLHNALAKRRHQGDLAISISLSPDATMLRVCDSGSTVREDVLDELFQRPVTSENGFGIGLFNTARLADAFGFQVRLVSNQPGQVCFEMSKCREEKL